MYREKIYLLLSLSVGTTLKEICSTTTTYQITMTHFDGGKVWRSLRVSVLSFKLEYWPLTVQHCMPPPNNTLFDAKIIELWTPANFKMPLVFPWHANVRQSLLCGQLRLVSLISVNQYQCLTYATESRHEHHRASLTSLIDFRVRSKSMFM